MNISSQSLEEKRSGSFFSPMRWKGILVTMLTVFLIYCFSNPLVLSVDSTYGFLAYKGTLLFHSFNMIPEISVRDIGHVNPVFVSWWSPGQWIFPALLNLLFGTRLGIAAILVTAISLITGFIGYYRVFIFYGFSITVSTLSLLVIISGSTLYYCFIVYQGGEILEFAFFPWFLLYMIRIRKISVGYLLVIAALFLLCFIAKTTLLIYCGLALIAKVFQMGKTVSTGRYRFFFKHLLLFLPALILVILIYIFYLSRGPRPGLIHQFGLSADGILVPLTSPLCSILSIQQWIERIDRLFTGSLIGSATAYIILILLYLLTLVVFLYLFSCVMVNRKIDPSYKSLFCILYGGLVVFFLFAYAFNANIDFSSRHFKLMGYLFIPGCLTILQDRIRQSWIHFLLVLCCMACIVDIFYLKGKWTGNRYIAENYFYRNCSELGVNDKLDPDSYKKLISIDRQITKSSARPVVFFVESTSDIAMELRHLYIVQSPAEDIPGRIYRGDGPGLIVCVSKKTLSASPDFLRAKFPDYGNFDRIDETSQYFFFRDLNSK
jgi:hypothetical protein